jgi:hypothetical protein
MHRKLAEEQAQISEGGTDLKTSISLQFSADGKELKTSTPLDSIPRLVAAQQTSSEE